MVLRRSGICLNILITKVTIRKKEFMILRMNLHMNIC